MPNLKSAFLQVNYRFEKNLYISLKDLMSNSVDPDEPAYYKPSHLDLCCLQKPIIMPVAVKELNPLNAIKFYSVLKGLDFSNVLLR